MPQGSSRVLIELIVEIRDVVSVPELG
jgi:hypothetical protein